MSETYRSEAAVVAEIVKDHLRPVTLELSSTEPHVQGAASLAAVPNGIKIVDLKPYVDALKTRPDRREGIANLTDLASFVGHAKRFAGGPSALFAAQNGTASASLTCVFDYHSETWTGDPGFRKHRGVYQFPVSEEWAAWHASNGKWVAQDAFAEFVEARLLDVLDPTSAGQAMGEIMKVMGTFAGPSRLLELSRGLALRIGKRVAQQVNLQTGETQLQFAAEHQDETGAPLKVPSAFLVGIPVFKMGALYQIAVRLRYRVAGSSVVWAYELYRADRVFDHAFREACNLARDETKLPLFYGTPE